MVDFQVNTSETQLSLREARQSEYMPMNPPNVNCAKDALTKFFPPARRGIQQPSSSILYRSERREGLPAADLRVLGIAPDDGACGHYRVRYPLTCLAEQGAAVEVRQAGPDIPLDAYLAANILFLSRACGADTLERLKAVARLTGAALVYDLDDCLHAVAPTSPAYPGYDPDTDAGIATLDSIRHFLAGSDASLFSTRELASFYTEESRQGHVFLNGLDLTLGDRDWDTAGPRFDWRSLAERQGCAVDGDSLLLGWAGGATHRDSLEELGDAVSRILAQTKNTFFGIFTEPHLAAHFCVERWGLPLRRVVFLPPVPFREHPRVLSAFDLALAPLRNDLFNRCKSPLRLLENGAWGTPYVASKVAPYWRFHVESGGQGGEIATGSDDFVRHAVRLLGDGDERRAKGDFLRTYVRGRHDVRRTHAHLADTLRAVRAGRTQPLQRPPAQALADAWTGVPRVDPRGPAVDSFCPCGSGATYAACPRGCAPAFGPLGGHTLPETES